MNIVMVGEYYNPNLIGGAEIQAMRRAEGLVKMGLEVTVISFDGNVNTKYETINGVKVIRYLLPTHKAKMLSLAVPIARALRKHEQGTDIYHLYNTHPLPAAGLYKITGGRKPVLANLENYSGYCPLTTAMYGKCDTLCRFSCLTRESHNTFERIIAFVYAGVYPLLRYLAKKADRYIAVSDYVKQEYIKQGFDEDKISVIPNSLDINCFSNRSKIPHAGTNILYVGRMSEEKGVSVLISAFSNVSKTHENIRLILVGDGPALPEYRELVRKNEIQEKVTFTGYQSESHISNFYSVADIFVHPAVCNEPFGITLLEAMASEVPILVSNVGSLAQIVNNAGIIFNKGDISDLTNKLTSLIEDEEKRVALSKNCKSIVDLYSDEKVLKTLIDTYRQLNNNNKLRG